MSLRVFWVTSDVTQYHHSSIAQLSPYSFRILLQGTFVPRFYWLSLRLLLYM